jgi:hypothetical protein
MSIDTRAYYKDVTSKEIFHFIRLFFDPDAKHRGMKEISEDYSQIIFTYNKKENRQMHVHKKVIDVKADMKKWNTNNPTDIDSGIYVQQGLPDKTKGTSLSLGMWGASVEIFKVIALLFGGYIDDNDSDAKGYYYVEKDHRKLIKKAF